MAAYINASRSPGSGSHSGLSTGLVVLSLQSWHSDQEQLYEIMSYTRYAVTCISVYHKYCFLVFFYFKLAGSFLRSSASLQSAHR